MLFYSNQGISPLHLGTELEALELFRKDGFDISIVKCEAQLKTCFGNTLNNPIGCSICIARTKKFHDQINIPKDNIYNLKPESSFDFNLEIPFFNNLDELKEYSYKGANIGRGVASSLLSRLRDFNINSEKYSELIEIGIKTSVHVFENFSLYIGDLKPDRICFFNGRFMDIFPVIELCRLKKIPFFSIEVGSNKTKKFKIYDNSLPHSLQNLEKVMVNGWTLADKESRAEIAEQWFISRQNKTINSGTAFLSTQKDDELPENFDKEKMNVVIFNSSEDEVKFIKEWEHTLYAQQNEAIQKILERFKDQHDFHFYLRFHPNLKGIKNEQTMEPYKWKYRNFTIIEPHNKVDTYFLMKNASKVITFGSTTGIEASYCSVPSILFGKSWYMFLNAAYLPNSYKELFSLIENIDLPAIPFERVLPFGYHYINFGEDYKSFSYKDKMNAFYEGVKIKRISFSSIYQSLRLVYQFRDWYRMFKLFNARSPHFSEILKINPHQK